MAMMTAVAAVIVMLVRSLDMFRLQKYLHAELPAADPTDECNTLYYQPLKPRSHYTLTTMTTIVTTVMVVVVVDVA